jgi:hypothetical protein
MAFDTTNLLVSNKKLFDAFDQALAITKKAIHDNEGWNTIKGSTLFKGRINDYFILIIIGHDEHIYTWKKEVPGMTVPMWKAKTLLHKSPEHFQDVFLTKYSEVLKAAPVPPTDARVIARLSPTVRVVYQRHQVHRIEHFHI